MTLGQWPKHIHYACTVLIYIIFTLCLCLNLYALVTDTDTIYYLRIYHMVCGLLMVCCIVVQIEFLVRTRKLPKLKEPFEIPDPALIGAIALTIGIILGYLYFVVYNYAFRNCDKLVDAIYSSELWLETFYDFIMAIFSGISLLYIIHRRYYGSINSYLDQVARLFINMTFTVVWVKVVVFKGYLSYSVSFDLYRFIDYFRRYANEKNYPVIGVQYPNDITNVTHIMISMELRNLGLLNTAIISCASEFFPVLLVSHWLACGGAVEKAEQIEIRMKKKEGIRGMMKELMKDISRVYVAEQKLENAALEISSYTKIFFWTVVPISMIISTAKWMFYFYYAIDYDELEAKNYLTNDFVNMAANVVQLVFCAGLVLFVYSVKDERLDAHHKAHARGDISILFGCCFVLLVKVILQGVEVEFQKLDGFTSESDALIQIINMVLVQAAQWIQYFAVRRLLSLSDQDFLSSKKFLPLAGLCGLHLAWVHFGITFFQTNLIKYQLTDETFPYSATTLICMIFTQTLFPAEYLFSFTISGCYLELLQRFLNMGYFQIGEPLLPPVHGHGHGHGHGAQHGKYHGGETKDNKVSNMFYAMSVIHKKRQEADKNEVSGEK